MGASGGFPVDLVLFGMIAAFLVLRLRSILGKREGFERPEPPMQTPLRPTGGPVIDARAEPPMPPAPTHTIPDAGSPTAQALGQMRALDPGFDPTRFLTGADQAFRMIVSAFAAGDRVALHPLLGEDTYKAFEQAIAAREKAGETQTAEIKAMHHIAIESAEVKGNIGLVTVRIVSDQVSYTHDRNGRPVAGTDAVTEITDIWTFERDLSQQDPTWRLVAARSG